MAATIAEARKWPKPPYDPVKSTTVITFHLMAILGVVLWYYEKIDVSWWTIVFAVVRYQLTSFGVTAGYHRLFAHPTYKAATILKVFLLLLGAAAFQGPALIWAALHRAHHWFGDTERDPYCILRGKRHAHMGWVMRRTFPDLKLVKDLLKDRLVCWQNKFDIPLELSMCFGVPALIGWAWGEVAGSLFVAGFIRLVIQWHLTFSVNSVAHWWGENKWLPENTSRATSWIVSCFLGGEGRRHDWHHFVDSKDYRVGGLFDPDFAKWFIWVCWFFGLAWDLRRYEPEHLEQAA